MTSHGHKTDLETEARLEPTPSDLGSNSLSVHLVSLPLFKREFILRKDVTNAPDNSLL